MGITLIIVGGVAFITAMALTFDYLGNTRKRGDKELGRRVLALEKKVAEVESASRDKDERIAKLESDLGFMNKLLEDRSK